MGEFFLEFQQVGTDFGDRCDLGGGLARLVGAQRRIVEVGGLQGTGHVCRGPAGMRGGPANRAIEQPRIEVRQLEMGGQALGERAFAGRRRPVDGDQERFHAASIRAPSPFINWAKPGKLVSIGEPSSTATGSRAASPSTRNDMAMRWSRCVATRPPPAGGAPGACTTKSAAPISCFT